MASRRRLRKLASYIAGRWIRDSLEVGPDLQAILVRLCLERVDEGEALFVSDLIAGHAQRLIEDGSGAVAEAVKGE